MTTRVVIENFGPSKIEVELLAPPPSPEDDVVLVSTSSLFVGEKAEFYVHRYQCLLVKEEECLQEKDPVVLPLDS